MFLSQNAPSTIIHRLHPFTKMAVGAGFSGLALCLKNPVALSVLLVFMLVVLAVARVQLTRWQWFSIGLFLSVISTLNFLASHDTLHAAAYSIRFAVFLTAMPILAATTDPQQMLQALSRTPVPGGVAMALLLVWRFFPLMAEEARQIRQAALLRGCAANGMVAGIYRGLLIPLAFCVIEYTDRITLALELRGFTPSQRRTCHRPLRAGARDIGFSLAALCAVGASAWLEWGNF
ncbi:MAG: energy-coupling factor transporter transmembrane component T family protein [Desulfosoma sp.]|uniref:energy-coupling factor transporter transmembrane component T family protein n=1 Tax=Desulfosoma sp. TaxID=2603217 RepID=UPI004048FF1C